MRPLTDRQRQVAALVSEGLSRRGIAMKLQLSENTVKVYLQQLALKFPGEGSVMRRIILAWRKAG